MPIARAIEEAHYPATFEGRDAALGRLAFDELLALQLGMVQRRRQRVRDAAPVVTLDDATRTGRSGRRWSTRSACGSGSPIELTVDQDTAMTAIREDLARPTPMLRLLQGDVGSGKTAVAAYALAATARAGLQGALLAPTDLLARQHLETVGRAARGARDRRHAPDRLAQGGRQGQGAGGDRVGAGAGRRRARTRSSRSAVTFADLGLVIIDEQHRFGVDQRGQLEAKAGGRSPHVLLMTATPDPAHARPGPLRRPRRLRPAHAARPAGSRSGPGSAGASELDGTWRKVRDEAALGHRTFVVVPLIEEGARRGPMAPWPPRPRRSA